LKSALSTHKKKNGKVSSTFPRKKYREAASGTTAPLCWERRGKAKIRKVERVGANQVPETECPEHNGPIPGMQSG